MQMASKNAKCTVRYEVTRREEKKITCQAKGKDEQNDLFFNWVVLFAVDGTIGFKRAMCGGCFRPSGGASEPCL